MSVGSAYNSAQNGHPQTNGHMNGENDSQSILSSPKGRAHSSLAPMSSMMLNKRASKPVLHSSASYSRFTNTFVSEQHNLIRNRCQKELGGRVGSYAFDTSFTTLMQWIRSERLTRLPHRGGSWDRVLIIVQHFAEQLNQFTHSIGYFTDDSDVASHLIYGHCLLLLELGYENSAPLERAFSMFYQFGLEIVPLLRRRDLFSAVPVISEKLGRVFSDLLNIVTAVAITFYQAVHSGQESMVVDVYRTFGSQIEEYRYGVMQASYAMWEYALGEDDGLRLQILRRLLSPQDSVLAFLAANRTNITSRPEQFTCTWFQPHLTSFIRSDERVLMIEGKAGTGKTTLANWTIDRLHRSVARKNMTTITFFFNSNIPAQSTSLALVQTLLHQLLVHRIGDVYLFNAVNEALKPTGSLHKLHEQEDAMWEALRAVISTLTEADGDSLAIVVDGMNEMDAQKPAMQKACHRLFDLAKSPAVRIITFSQPLETSPISFTRISLTPEYLYADITTITRSLLQRHPQFHKVADQDKIIEQLAKAADASMLWVYLACQYILHCTSLEDAVRAIIPSSKNINDAIQKVLSVAPLDQDAKTVVSFMVTAQRPLLVDEIKLLLQAQQDRYMMIDRQVSVSSIIKSLRPFLLRGEGLVSIRHSLIKQALIASGSKMPLESRHKDFVLKLLIYAKTCLIGDHQPTIEALDFSQVDKKLSSHRFLEYVIRYWTVHFKKSSFHKPDGSLDLPKEFNTIMPNSVMFTLLEEGCWATQTDTQEAIDLCTLAFHIRRTLYGEQHPCVLQSAIIVARMYEIIMSRASDAIEWYVRATKMCRGVLGLQSDLTIALCQIVVRISDTIVITKRSTVTTWREEILIIMISSYTQRYGETSTEVVEIMEKLVELYISIEEEEKVIEWRKKIEIIVSGHGHSQGSYEYNGSRELSMTLKKHRHKEDLDSFEDVFLGGYVAEGEVEFSFEDVERIWSLIAVCIQEGQFEKAEELYIELWLRLTEQCHTHYELEWHCKKIEIMIAYSRFLHTHKRVNEACTILLCIWKDYEHHEFSSFEKINILLKDVAVLMKSMSMLSVALAVFRKCWSWFKHAHKTETVIFQEIETQMTSTSMEIVKSTTTSTSTTTSETIVRSVFESAISSSENITTTTVELCRSLASTYVKEERYSEAITCIEMTLKKSWSSFFYESERTCTLTSSFSSENIELVMKLAHCYMMQKRYEKVEEIYVRLYRVYRKSYTVEHTEVVKYSEILVAFYKEIGYWAKAISFYQELLVDYRAFYGVSHEITIRTLYAVADLTRQHHISFGYWIEYYIEIVTNLNKGAVICHEKALRALIIVAEYHYEALRYSEALVYFKSLFATFVKFGSTYKYFEQVTEVHKLVEHYFSSIEESRVDIEVHIKMVEEVRESCVKFFGESSAIAISTSLALATVCRRSEKHEFRAIAMYEHVSKHSKTVSKEVKSSLQYLYFKRITSTSTTSVSKETIETATTITYERYIETRKTYSCTHEKTMTELSQLIQLWYKQNKKELIIKELRTMVLEIIYVKSSKELVDCSKSLAEMYISCGYQNEALEFLRALRMQVIYKSVSKDCGFKVTAGRECLAFIAALEYYVRADWSLSIAILMADLVAEYSYYQRFSHSMKAGASWEVIFTHGARLRRIHLRRGRQFSFIENETLNYFCQVESQVTKHCHRPAIKQFIGMLFEYCSSHKISIPFTKTVGHATTAEVRSLMKQKKECLELTKCAFYFLMAHEGLDDTTEITMGFQLCLLMSRGDAAMVDFSKKILHEIFAICENSKINIARLRLDELNELIEMIGQQKDYEQLHKLLRKLWESRESQSKWPTDAILKLGMRLVQAEFAAGHYKSATKLCEDIVYNIRRVHGPRHEHTIRMYELLASLYTSTGLKSNERDARTYFKKSMTTQEEILKALAGVEDDEDDDDDGMTDYNHPGDAAAAAGEAFPSHQDELDAVARNIRKFRLSMQRYGGWTKPAGEYERLTDRIWSTYGAEMKLKEDEVRAAKWKADKVGADQKYDAFDVPKTWAVLEPTTVE